MKRTSTLSIVTMTGSLVFALNISAANTFTGVSATEMPAKAASLVSATKADQREAVTQSLVTEAMAQRPMVGASLVGAIAKSTPDMASVAALAAVMQDAKQIGPVTKAAVAAAHSQAGKIVSVMCEKFPSKYNLIAMAAFEAAPEASKEILAAVSSAVPALKPFIARANSTTLPGVIAETEQSLQSAAIAAKTSPDNLISTKTVASAPLSYSPVLPPPTNDPHPFVTPSGPPTEINRNDTGVVAPGAGRSYNGL